MEFEERCQKIDPQKTENQIQVEKDQVMEDDSVISGVYGIATVTTLKTFHNLSYLGAAVKIDVPGGPKAEGKITQIDGGVQKGHVVFEDYEQEYTFSYDPVDLTITWDEEKDEDPKQWVKNNKIQIA